MLEDWLPIFYTPLVSLDLISLIVYTDFILKKEGGLEWKIKQIKNVKFVEEK